MERYVIEFENGSFAHFEQTGEREVYVCDCEDLTEATFLTQVEANEHFNDLLKSESYWEFYGDYPIPKKIRKVTLILE